MSNESELIKREIITRFVYNHDESLHQGDFIRNVDYLESFYENEGNIEISLIQFPLIVVLTQECDATQDFENRTRFMEKEDKFNHQYLLSVIVAPVYNVEDLRTGKHLENLNLTYKNINSSDFSRIRQNREARYHYMKIEVVPDKYAEYVIDFKHYFTVNVEQMLKYKKNNYMYTLSDLFKESLSHRFANYLSRIGLPESNSKSF